MLITDAGQYKRHHPIKKKKKWVEDLNRHTDGQKAHDEMLSSVLFSSVAELCPTLCDPMKRSTPCFPVHHQLPGITQNHAHQFSDAI